MPEGKADLREVLK